MRTTKFSMVLTALIVALVAAVAGCGTSTESASAGGNGNNPGGGQDAGAVRNPCDLITPDELAAIVKAAYKLGATPKVTQTDEVGEFQGRKCVWQYPRKVLGSDATDISVAAWHGTRVLHAGCR